MCSSKGHSLKWANSNDDQQEKDENDPGFPLRQSLMPARFAVHCAKVIDKYVCNNEFVENKFVAKIFLWEG